MAAPSFHQIQDRCLRISTDYVGELFTYQGVEYRGIISEVKNSRDIDAGGYRHTARLSIYVNKNTFPEPIMGKIVFARGKEYFMAGYSADAISYLLELEDPNR